MPVKIAELPEFIEATFAAQGNFNDEALQARFAPFDLEYVTVVDQDLSPFSQEYFDQQIALYSEISGRSLNQEEGELHPDDLSAYLDYPNPTASYDASAAAEQMRAISAMASLATLPLNPRVLDLGAGGGMSSEILALAGCRVHAIDIDPAIGAFARERAKRKLFNIERSDLNFDAVGSLENGAYSAAFFFQSFHHCLTPWKLIADLADKLEDDGVIAFTGEPVQDRWWKNWGLRLDMESVFVARQHGWFESGWSLDFLRQCFERSGFTLTLLTGGYLTGEIGIATRSEAKRATIMQKALYMGVKETGEDDMRPDRFGSSVGSRTKLAGRDAFVQDKGPGTIMFGPYVRLKPGRYKVSLLAHRDVADVSDALVVDVIGEVGEVRFCDTEHQFAPNEFDRLIEMEINVEKTTSNVEIRAHAYGDSVWTVCLPDIQVI